MGNERRWYPRENFTGFQAVTLFEISFAICIVLPDRFLLFRASHSSATSPLGYPINLKSSLGWYNFLPTFFFHLCTCCHRNRFTRLIDEGKGRYIFKSICNAFDLAWPFHSCMGIVVEKGFDSRAIKKLYSTIFRASVNE